MCKVLWLENQAARAHRDMLAFAIAAGHRVTFVPDVTQASQLLASFDFDLFIVDIVVEPGTNPAWRSYYDRLATIEARQPRLGIQLLRSLWDVKPDQGVPATGCPSWLTPKRVGLLTIEVLDPPASLQQDLTELGLPPSHYVCKGSKRDTRPLLRDLIQLLADENGLKKASAVLPDA